MVTASGLVDAVDLGRRLDLPTRGLDVLGHRCRDESEVDDARTGHQQCGDTADVRFAAAELGGIEALDLQSVDCSALGEVVEATQFHLVRGDEQLCRTRRTEFRSRRRTPWWPVRPGDTARPCGCRARSRSRNG
jgi:hypothetical protein